MSYDHREHCHRFSVWAAARAAQRGFTSIENLRDALETTSIREFVSNTESSKCDAEQYDTLHRKWCNDIIEHLGENGVSHVTFGRAAKLVAVYVKSMVVITSDSHTSLAAVAYPPIDRVLLQNLARLPDQNEKNKKLWRKIAWTQLDEDGYYKLLASLREVVPSPTPWWKIEQYWTVTN